MRSRGFTLIELMIVVAIIGILAAIAIPKFADLLRKSNEGATRGNLDAVRSAISVYYSDMEGQYPGKILGLTINAKYLKAIPTVKTPPHHPDSNAHDYTLGPEASTDSGRWGYDNTPSDPGFGSLWIACTHTDSKGKVWTSY